jgi:hypothetical protein
MYCLNRPSQVRNSANATIRHTSVAPFEETINVSSAFMFRSAITRSLYTFKDQPRDMTAANVSKDASSRAEASTEANVIATAARTKDKYDQFKNVLSFASSVLGSILDTGSGTSGTMEPNKIYLI